MVAVLRTCKPGDDNARKEDRTYPPPPPPPAVGRRPRKTLGLASEVPEHQRSKFIVGYYRLERPRLQQLFAWHNETLNIWTHLIGTIYFVVRGFTWIRARALVHDKGIPGHTSSVYDSAMVLLVLVSSGSCMAASSFFHWRSCTPKREHMCLVSFDRSGIVCFIFSSFFGGISLGYSCFPTVQKVYLVLTVFASVGMAASLTFPALQECSRWILFVGGLWGLIPTLHWYFFIATKTMLDEFGAGMVAMTILYILSGFVYSSGFPERLAPGMFDLVGASHQLFHCFVFGGAAIYMECIIRIHGLMVLGPALCQ